MSRSSATLQRTTLNSETGLAGRPQRDRGEQRSTGARGERETLQTVRRAMSVLVALANARGGEVGITSLANSLGLPNSIVHRILSTLVSAGFVTQNPLSAKYRVGPRAFEVGSTFARFRQLEPVARVHLKRLSEDTGHGILLGVREGPHVLYLMAFEGYQRVRIAAHPGERRWLHTTASGKALLLGVDRAHARELLGVLQPVTPRTVTSWPRLLAELARAQEIGLAFGFGEHTPGVGGVAAPVRDSTNQIVASIALSIPFGTSTSRDFLQLAVQVRDSARQLSESLGASLEPRQRSITIEASVLKDPSIWMTR